MRGVNPKILSDGFKWNNQNKKVTNVKEDLLSVWYLEGIWLREQEITFGNLRKKSKFWEGVTYFKLNKKCVCKSNSLNRKEFL